VYRKDVLELSYREIEVSNKYFPPTQSLAYNLSVRASRTIRKITGKVSLGVT
jgi:hypothetical protein